MPVCINEARPGGRIRYEWSNGKAAAFPSPGNPGAGAFQQDRACRAHARSPIPHPTITSSTTFAADGDGTLMTMRMTLPSAEVRAAMLASGMEHGMEASYVRLESQFSGAKS